MPTERVFSPKDGRWVFATSKFCRATGKCVDDFDHYCLWLNNSIGAANYAPFLYALVSASALVLLQTGVCCAQVILWGVDLDYFKEHAADTVLSSETDLGIILCVFLFTLIIGLGFLFQLLFFHAYLIYHGITTYEFVADRERMRAVAAQGLQGVQPRFMVGTPASRRARRAKIRAEHAAFAARRLAIRAAVWRDILAALKEKPGMDAKAQQHFVRDFAPVAYAQRCREQMQGDKGVQGGSGATAPGIEMTTAGAAARNTMQSHESATSAAGSVTAAKHLPGRGAVAPATSGEAVQGGLPEGWASGADSGAAAIAAPASTEDADAAVASGAPEGIEIEGAALPASKSAVDVAVASQSSGVLEGGPEAGHDSASAGDGDSDDGGGSHGSSREEGGEGGGQHPSVEQRASDAAEESPITEGVDTEAGSQQVRSEASSSSLVDDTADPGVESAAAEEGGAQGGDAAHHAAQSDDG